MNFEGTKVRTFNLKSLTKLLGKLTSFTHLLLVQKLLNLFKSVSHVYNLSTAAFNHSEFFTKFFIGQIPNCSFVEISKHFRIGDIWLNSTVFFPIQLVFF